MQKLGLRRLWTIEGIWWLFTVLAVVIIFLPIPKPFDFQFRIENVVCLVVVITFARYILMLQNFPLYHSIIAKAILIFLCIPIGFYLASTINEFQTFRDDFGSEALLNHLDEPLSFKKQNSILGYIIFEFEFLATAALVCTVLMPLKMIRSIWRTHNKGTG